MCFYIYYFVMWLIYLYTWQFVSRGLKIDRVMWYNCMFHQILTSFSKYYDYWVQNNSQIWLETIEEHHNHQSIWFSDNHFLSYVQITAGSIWRNGPRSVFLQFENRTFYWRNERSWPLLRVQVPRRARVQWILFRSGSLPTTISALYCIVLHCIVLYRAALCYTFLIMHMIAWYCTEF